MPRADWLLRWEFPSSVSSVIGPFYGSAFDYRMLLFLGCIFWASVFKLVGKNSLLLVVIKLLSVSVHSG